MKALKRSFYPSLYSQRGSLPTYPNPGEVWSDGSFLLRELGKASHLTSSSLTAAGGLGGGLSGGLEGASFCDLDQIQKQAAECSFAS